MEMNTHPTQFVRVPPLLTLSAKGEFSDIQKDCKDAGTVFINRCCAPTAGFQRFPVGFCQMEMQQNRSGSICGLK